MKKVFMFAALLCCALSGFAETNYKLQTMKRTSLMAMLFALAFNMIAQQEKDRYRPGMFETERYLYAAQKNGLYKLEQTMAAIPVKWELAGFADVPICQTIIKGDSIIATTMLEGPDSLLLLSTDGGKSFTDCTPDLWSQNRIDKTLSITPYSITASPADANVLVVNVYNSGIYQSIDFGKTWSLLPYIAAGTFVAYNPNDGKQLFACYESMAMCGEICMSMDGGMTWERVFSQSAVSPEGIVFHPTEKERMFAYGAGVCAISENQGYTWVERQCHLSEDLGRAVFSAAVYDNVSPNTIYAAKSDDHEIAIYQSNDDGYSWTMIVNTHSESGVGVVGSLCLINRTLYANTTDGGILTFELDENLENSMSPCVFGNPSATFYDLQGRPVAHPIRGIYIKDGKKLRLSERR